MKKLTALLFCTFLSLFSQAQQPFTFTEFDLYPGKPNSQPKNFYLLGSKMFFKATDSSHGNEPWVSDGTLAGTNILKDIYPGKYGSGMSYFAVINNKLYFNAVDSTHGNELWVSDGTPNGTNIVKDINKGQSNSTPQELVAYNNYIIFSATDSISGTEVWISDGTDTGTHILKDIYPGKDNSYPTNYKLFNGKIYFIASTANGKDMWCTDGTTSGTVQVPNIFTGSSIYLRHSANGKMYMSQYVTQYNNEIWVTDGTASGTQLLVESVPGNLYGISTFYTFDYKGKVLMLAVTPFSTGKAFLYITDGTPNGTLLLKTFRHRTTGYTPLPDFCEYDGKVYFRVSDGNGTFTYSSLCVTDGTIQNTEIVKDVNYGRIAEPTSMTKYNGYLYCTASLLSGNVHLVRLDGTDTGNIMVSPPSPKLNPVPTSSPLFVYDSTLYYVADYYGNGLELWSLKDTSIKKIPPPPNNIVINKHAKQSLPIYPNPNEGVFTVDLPSAKQAEMIISDISGRVILKEKVTDKQKYRMDIRNQPKGIYLLQLTTSEGMYHAKVQVE